jgi:hypothetical protein
MRRPPVLLATSLCLLATVVLGGCTASLGTEALEARLGAALGRTTSHFAMPGRELARSGPLLRSLTRLGSDEQQRLRDVVGGAAVTTAEVGKLSRLPRSFARHLDRVGMRAVRTVRRYADGEPKVLAELDPGSMLRQFRSGVQEARWATDLQRQILGGEGDPERAIDLEPRRRMTWLERVLRRL